MKDRINVLDRVSWERKSDGVRTFGHVERVVTCYFIVVCDKGIRHAVRRRDITKECR